MSLTGIRDVDLLILGKLTDEDLLSYCLTSQKGRQLCQNENFWMNRFIKKFGKHEKSEKRAWKDFYLAVVYYLNEYSNVNIAMAEAAEKGYRDLVDLFISKGSEDWYYPNENKWDIAMAGAARGGHRDLVDFFISKGADDWDHGMIYAAEGGHRDLVDFFISKGAYELGLGMRYAEKGGHQDLVDFFKRKMRE